MTSAFPRSSARVDRPAPEVVPAPPSMARQHERIRALGSAGALLHLGAHPDDEESGMLTYVSRREGARAVYWSATRGEGGQNRRGPERAAALGIVRTWESLEARRIDGGEVRYGPFYDFGFSKSGEDTLRRWGRDAVVAEVVRAIRQVRPLVVVSRWSGTTGDGHGHHQAVGLVAEQAFADAADPSRFPELGLPPWQAAKLYRSVAGDWQPGEDGSFGTVVEEWEGLGYLRIDTGEVDPVTGLTYQEQAVAAVNQHRSQGMGFVSEPGPYHLYYRLVHPTHRAATRETGFFDGLDPTLPALAADPVTREQLRAVCRSVDDAVAEFRPDRPADCVPALLTGRAALAEVVDELATAGSAGPSGALADHLAARLAEFDVVVAGCLLVRTECLVDSARVTPGATVPVTVRVWSGSADVELDEVRLHAPAGWAAVRSADAPRSGHPTASAPFRADFDLTVPEDADPRSPYWLREPAGPYRYAWPAAAAALAQALDDPLVWVEADVRARGQIVTVAAAAAERSGYPGGARTLPLTVLPPLALAPRQQREILPAAAHELVLDLDVTARCLAGDGVRTELALIAPEAWTVDPPTRPVVLAGVGDASTVRFRVLVPPNAPADAYTLGYAADVAGRSCAVEVTPVRLGGPGSSAPPDEATCVAEAHMVRPATVSVDLVEARFVRTLRYGYVRGLDEQILPALARFDLDVTELDDDQLQYADLGVFDTIVVGPNAYGVRPAVRRAATRLLDYVAGGGTLVVQYQTYGYDTAGFAPHPLRFHQPHDRVTDPQATVTILDEGHPVMNLPNALGPADFAGWTHDRGMYFMGEWDRRFRPVLACADLGEEPRAGGLLTAAHGRGTYVYCGYSFHRQLPAGVPGAIRLFANLLGLAEIRIRERMATLRASDLFAFMTDTQLYEAARTVSERWLDAGSLLARQGDSGREMFLVVDGSIEVRKRRDDGSDVVLHLAHAGEVVGELTLLAAIPRSADLRAVTESVVLIVRDDVLNGWLERHPDLARSMMRRLAERIVATGSSL